MHPSVKDYYDMGTKTIEEYLKVKTGLMRLFGGDLDTHLRASDVSYPFTGAH
jgi:hypothetical protein